MKLSIIKDLREDYTKRLILSGFLLLLLLHLIFAFAGFYNDDDINFARYAAEIAYNGISSKPATNHFQLRWNPIYPTAFFYRFFGISAFTSTLFSAGCVFLSSLLVHRIIRKQKVAVYLLVMTCFFFSRSIVFYSHRLLSDAGVCLSVIWMYYAYRRYSDKLQQPFLHALIFSSGLIFGVVTKETIIIALPLFAALFLRDVLRKRIFIFWIYSFVVSLLFTFCYLLYFRISTGDFFFRYHLLIAGGYLNICSFDQLPFLYTLKRITYGLWQAMLLNGDMLLILPGLLAAVYYRKIAYTGLRRIDLFAFLVLLLSSNFMTISATDYVPLCQDPRHFIFVLPFAAVVSGVMLYAYFRESRKFPGLPLIFLLATLIMFMMQAGSTKYLYLSCALLFTVAYVIPIFGRRHFNLFVYVCILSVNYIIDFIQPMYPYYWDHKKVIENTFAGKNLSATVFSDGFSSEMSEFFLKFKTGDVRFLPVDSIGRKNRGVLYYLYDGRLGSQTVERLLRARGAVVVARSRGVILYRVDDAFLRKVKGEHPHLTTGN